MATDKRYAVVVQWDPVQRIMHLSKEDYTAFMKKGIHPKDCVCHKCWAKKLQEG